MRPAQRSAHRLFASAVPWHRYGVADEAICNYDTCTPCIYPTSALLPLLLIKGSLPSMLQNVVTRHTIVPESTRMLECPIQDGVRCCP